MLLSSRAARRRHEDALKVIKEKVKKEQLRLEKIKAGIKEPQNERMSEAFSVKLKTKKIYNKSWARNYRIS